MLLNLYQLLNCCPALMSQLQPSIKTAQNALTTASLDHNTEQTQKVVQPISLVIKLLPAFIAFASLAALLLFNNCFL